MTEFYTSALRRGNNILYRGYKNGEQIRKKIAFKPTLYIAGDSKSEWRTLDGQSVVEMEFDDMSAATDFINMYKDVANVTVYGMNNYVNQFITKKFPKRIEFDRSLVNVINLDIEVASDSGFPEPDVAEHPVISIALRANDGTYWVWGMGDYTPADNVLYIKCDNEFDLLTKFVNYWSTHTPDAITGLEHTVL